MYNLIEYSDNHLDTNGSWEHYKRVEVTAYGAVLKTDRYESVKYKIGLIEERAATGKTANSLKRDVKWFQ